MAASAISRRTHPQLQPLATSHGSVNGYAGRGPSTPSSVLSNTSTIPSPSVVAARAYFLERSPPIGKTSNALQRRRSLIEGQEFPRRHSALPTPGGLATKMAKFTFPDRNLEEPAESVPNIKIDRHEDGSLTEVKRNDLVKVTAVATAKRSSADPAPVSDFLQQVPFQYTHDRLRDWGFAYLGNTSTADAFINAVSLRRPSLQLVREDVAEDPPEQTGMVTIRARVLPKAKERKPFVIQRKFDIEELRASIPAVQRPVKSPFRRSHRARRLSLQFSSTGVRRRTPDSVGGNGFFVGNGAVPIRESVSFSITDSANSHRYRIRTTFPAGTCCIALVRPRQKRRLHRFAGPTP